MKKFIIIAFMTAACSSANNNINNGGTNNTNNTTNNDSTCVDGTDPGTVGIVSPIAGITFRNAFDPSDEKLYAPQDELPAPVMTDVWGDRAEGAHGTLSVFPAGFTAPLHTHSNDYHGVVIAGQLTNPFGKDLQEIVDGEKHGKKVLGAGSYWYVPANSHHTTTCMGPDPCIFYFYSDNAFDFSPIVNETGLLQVTLVDPAGAIALEEGEIKFAGEADSFVKFGGATGDMTKGEHGTFGLFNAGAVAPVHVHSADYYGIVISGTMTNPFGDKNTDALPPGSFWSVPAKSVHTTTCNKESECLFFFHSRSNFDFSPTCK